MGVQILAVAGDAGPHRHFLRGPHCIQCRSFLQQLLLFVHLIKLRTIFRQRALYTQILPFQARVILTVPVGSMDHIRYIPIFNNTHSLTIEDWDNIIPHDLFSLSHFKNMAVLRGGHQNISVWQSLRRALAKTEKAARILCSIFPDDFICFGVHFNNRGTVAFGPFGSVIKNLNVSVFEWRGIMRTEHFLITVVIPGGRFPLVIGARVAPAPFDVTR